MVESEKRFLDTGSSSSSCIMELNSQEHNFPLDLHLQELYTKDKDKQLTKLLLIIVSSSFLPDSSTSPSLVLKWSNDVLILGREEDTPSNSAEIHSMPVAVSSPFLTEAGRFSEDC